ncbi:MAG: hypothetical protein PHI73_05540 [Patescibacteria group bacterium]|nr:hypothetical protein [Patescibacteria group bacterium]
MSNLAAFLVAKKSGRKEAPPPKDNKYQCHPGLDPGSHYLCHNGILKQVQYDIKGGAFVTFFRKGRFESNLFFQSLTPQWAESKTYTSATARRGIKIH